ncbi:MAG TPA: aminoacyl-histidine dipeptidase [Thermoanaerobaculales bacterium]|nr:aminoacyl-histidine dipeptidase [Thermoanaerobaculales bacterium]HPA82494.1 aminoacyl-histidine dipeptidase [Thermoanaerobaculales bacterium]HQL29973.1 aminoacyl-histidine dipeptidase [Thermoanaerobaculales bacterium]HQN96850.1 aminoacyl-histidine dipeptidase [Thermoanaerobaculales bacterium]HQP44062.1 aminoacyl-histidine dipeptidase [Thermoanaerobaculales bacterium]
MSSPLESLEPKLLWTHFDAIRAIPRPSKHEERIAAHVEAWARGRGFEVRRDEIGNVAVRVPATPGHEGAPTVVLQGHLDMVCEKNSDVDRDFMSQGIDVAVDGDWVVARGTTLGADNGIGVATAMALAEDPSVTHGPLELLCTIDEETGLTGAKKLDPSLLSGRIMLNLDTEEDGAVYIGCAGGVDTTGEVKLSRRRGLLGSMPVRIAVLGLRGGHSGLNIIENRGNAIRLAVRTVLAAIAADIEIDLVSIDGGSKHNAIPREAFVVVRIDDSQLDRLRGVVATCLAAFREEFAATDPDLAVTVEPIEDSNGVLRPLNVHTRDRLLHLLDALPHGVLAMSRAVPGLVETSSNLAVVTTGGSAARIVTSQRSSVMPALYATQRQVRSVLELAGAAVFSNDPYPGWKPNPDSPIVRKAIDVYRALFGSEPAVKAIHAGLECGLLIEKIPDMDAVSIGPEIRGAHSPEERVQISSVQKFYRHTAAILKDLA